MNSTYKSPYHTGGKLVPKNLMGEIMLRITEDDDGYWYSELVPNILAREPRDVYKLALICASVQDHIKKNMTFMDAMIKTKEEVRKIHNDLVAEKTGKPMPDTVKYQQPLPFEEDKDED